MRSFRFLVKNKNLDGFTLVEILIVVIIVAILAAIAVPLYLTYVQGARAAEAETAIAAIWNANKIYYQKTGSYTSDLEALALQLEDVTEDRWVFSVIGGGDNLSRIEAVSTSDMEGGAGKRVVFDPNNSRQPWSGYGHD